MKGETKMLRASRVSVSGSVFAVILLLGTFAYGQTAATITGTISDQSGAVVPNAEIVITNVGTGQSRSLQSNALGRYTAPGLNPGSYEMTATSPGFQQTVRSGITLTVGSEAVINLTLQPGQVTQTVQVTAEVPLVQTTTSSVSGLVDSEKIRALPLNGRSFDQLVYLEPGVNVATAAGKEVNQGRGKKFSANGARTTSNYFMLDGTDINDSQNFTPGGAGGQLFGVEAIQEFQVLTHNQPAQYGRSMGAVINAVTRSGTNTLHGSAYEFLRNNHLDAKNYFDDPNEEIPQFKRNQFGGTLGGPILRDRVFVFGNYEGLRERLGVTKSGVTMDADARRGIIPGQDPISVNPAVAPYLELYPLPNGPSAGPGLGRYLGSASQPTRVDFGSARADWNVTDNDTFFFRYTIDDSQKVQKDLGAEVFGLFSDPENHRNQYVTASLTHLFSPTVLNSFRMGLNRSLNSSTLSNDANVPESLYFLPGTQFGQMTNRGGLSTCCATNANPKFWVMNSYQPSDDLTITTGNHTFKTGFMLNRYQFNTKLPQSPGGDYDFASLSDFLQGIPNSLRMSFPGSDFDRGIRALLFGTYFQDDWRVTDRLTLNLGLRYEITTVPTEVNGKLAFLLDPLGSTIEEGVQPFEGNHLNFAPRFGFAYDVTGDGRTSLRGGWGLFYDQILLDQFRNTFDRMPPYVKSVTLRPSATFVVPFPNPIEAARASPPQPTVTVADNFQTPYSQQFNLMLQREVRQDLMVSVGYVGSIGKHIQMVKEGNTRIPTVLEDGRLFTAANAPRRNPVFGGIQQRDLSGFSTYNALQMTALHRMSNGLQVQVVYSYGRSLDTSAGLFSSDVTNSATAPQNADRTFAEKGLSNFDIRNNAVINFNYDLPFANSLSGVAGHLLSGWGIGSILTLAQGVPFTVQNTANRSRSGATGARFSDRPDLVVGASNNPTSGVSNGCTFGTSSFPAGTPLGTPDSYFDPCSFTPQALGYFGTLGRNTLTGPGVAQFDLTLTKIFQIQEGRDLQFRAEFFNLANRPNFATPNSLGLFDNSGRLSGSTGSINETTTTSRQIQFGLKYTF